MNERRSPPIIYLGDRFLSGDEAPRVSLLDRGYLLGDSVFATFRGYGPRAFAREEHLRRLVHAAEAYGIICPLTQQEMNTCIAEALRRAAFASSAIRVTVSRGESEGGFPLSGDEKPLLSIVVRELPPPVPTFNARIVEARAIPAACLAPKHKVGSYMNHVQARREAAAHGASEAIMLAANSDAVVSGAASNLFALIQGCLVTPGEEDGARPGILRHHVLEMSRELGIRTEVRTLRVPELEQAEAILFTSSLLEIRSASAIGTRPIPQPHHPTVKKLLEQLRLRIDGALS